jgi:FKBP-type peptidyl-prolyl cis-trans isomerase FklB
MKIKCILVISSMSLALFTANLYAEEATLSSNQQQSSQAADSNKLVGQAFLAKNKSVPGVVTLPDGLQYKVIKPGNGPHPTASDTVLVNYEGRLINGTLFDSSYKHGKPVKFQVSEVIPGWTEALQHMQKGAIWELYVPASLAYGEQGMPPVIGPNQTLIFKIELLDINK